MPLFEQEQPVTQLPLFVEPAVDFTTGKLIFGSGGDVERATGGDALAIWIRKALDGECQRFAHTAHTSNYGNEFVRLLGSSRDIAENRMKEMVRSCLLVNPYITYVSGFDFTHKDSALEASFIVSTVYGDIFAESEAVYF